MEKPRTIQSRKPVPTTEAHHFILAIAIDEYSQPLNNSVADVSALIDVLTRRFTFNNKPKTVKLLNNEAATRKEIQKAFLQFRPDEITGQEGLKEADTLIVIFAGHGDYDPMEDTGWLTPSDGRIEDGARINYISDSDIIGWLNAIPAGQIILIVDACFGGRILTAQGGLGLRRKNNLQAAYLLTSGGVQTVNDGIPGEHSPFTKLLLQALNGHRDAVLSVADLGKQIALQMPGEGAQKPWHGWLKDSGTPLGEVILHLKPELLEKETGIMTAFSSGEVLGKYFKAIPIKEIEPFDLMPLRSQPKEGFREFYHERPYLDDRLYINYGIGQHTIITGKPLAGKTRTVLQLLKKLRNLDVMVLLPRDIAITKEHFDLPEEGRYLVFIDEMDRFLSEENRDWFLEKILSYHHQVFVVGTCWREKHADVRNSIPQYLHKFETLDIRRLEARDKEAVMLHAPEKRFFRSDDTIGSYYLPLHEMQKRYNLLPVEGLEREIMRSCKVLLYWNETITYATYAKDKICEYVLRRLHRHYGLNDDIFPAQWESAFRKLHDLGLVVESTDYLVVEESYLIEFIPVTKDALLKEYTDYFPSPTAFGKAIQLASTSESALSMFADFKKQKAPLNTYAYTILINKAGEKLDKNKLLAEMRRARIQPNVVTYNSLINKAASFSESRAILMEMREAGIHPDEVTYNSFLNKAAIVSEARAILKEMQEVGIHPNQVTYTSLINKAVSFSEARAMLTEMHEAGIQADEVTYNSLINKAASFSESRAILMEMQEASIHPNKVTYTSLINKAANFSEAQTVLTEMLEAGIYPDEVTYNSLINKAASFSEAQAILAEMQEARMQPNEVTHNSLINKAASFSEARAILTEMQEAGIRPNEVTYTTLINQASNFSEARAILTEMREAGIQPNEVTYNSLVDKASNVSEARAILMEMQDAGIRPNEVTYNSLINKAANFSEARAILMEMQEADLTPDNATKGVLQKIASQDTHEAREIILDITSQAPLFENRALNYVFVKECLPGMDEQAFFDQYGHFIVERGDDVIRLFADHLQSPACRMTLAEALEEKDWNYEKIMGDSYILLDWQQAERWLKKAMEKTPARFFPVIRTLLAKNIVLNYLEEKYPEAEQYCLSALKEQPQSDLHFSLMLLYRLVIWKTPEANLKESIRAITQQFPMGKTKLIAFLQSDFCCHPALAPAKIQILKDLRLYEIS